MQRLICLVNLFITLLILTSFSIASSTDEISETKNLAPQLIYGLPDEVWRQHIVPHVKGKDSKTLRLASHYFADLGVIKLKIVKSYIFERLIRKGILTHRATKLCIVPFTSDVAARAHTSLPNLVHLTLFTLGPHSFGSIGEFVTPLKKIPTLKHLSLKLNTALIKEDIIALSALSQLQSLKIGNMTHRVIPTSSAIENISLLGHNLQEFYISFPGGEIRDISNFNTLTKLKRLYLYDIYLYSKTPFSFLKVTGLNVLKNCPQLEEITLSDPKASKDTVKSIGEFPTNFKKIIFDTWCSVNENDIKFLQAEYPRIEFVLTLSKQVAPVK